MKIKQWYRIHKWLAVGTGLLLLLWLGTGLVMIAHHLVPGISGLPQPVPAGQLASAPTLTVSPAEAAAVAAGQLGDGTLRAIDLRPLGSRTVYRLEGTGTSALVDAQSGALVQVDSAMALELIRARYGVDSDVASFRRLESTNSSYPRGAVPALQFHFESTGATAFTVGESTGEIFRVSRSARFRIFMGAAHTLGQTRVILGRTGSEWFLAITSVLTAFAALTGFWIAWPKTWWPRTRRPRKGAGSAEEPA